MASEVSLSGHVLGLCWAVLGLSWPAWSCLGLCWSCFKAVLGLSSTVFASLDLSGGCLWLGYSLKIPEILKTFTYKCLFEILGFEIKPVLVCLGPILGCRDVPWACLQPVLGLSEAFRGRSWAVWRESGVVSSCLDMSGGCLGLGFVLEVARNPENHS